MNAGGLKGALLTRAVNTKLANWRETGEVKHAVYDALVFRKVRSWVDSANSQIRNLLGGEVMYMSSGAAPLSADVHELLKVCFSCDVIQGVSFSCCPRDKADDAVWNDRGGLRRSALILTR
jgi:long-chain acyl-CoA synthetase